MSDFYLFIRKELYYLGLLSLGAVPGAFIRWQIDDNFIVNICGSTVLGFLISFPLKYQYKLMLGVGFCGALTTFSSWMIDSVELILRGALLKALALIFSAFVFGLAAAAIGFIIGKRINSSRPFLLRFLFRRY